MRDYGLPILLLGKSLLTRESVEPNGYTWKKAMAKIDKDGGIKSDGYRAVLLMNFRISLLCSWSHILTLQTQSFTTSEDACPESAQFISNYSNGYFKVPSGGRSRYGKYRVWKC